MVDTLAHPHLLAVTVHGPAGVLDLVVPSGAVAADVAEEYARAAGLAAAPDLRTRVGVPIPADAELARAGIATGDLLVATAGGPPPATRRTPSTPAAVEARDAVAPSGGAWFVLAAAAAAGLAGWCATAADGATRTATLALLGVGVLVGVLPVGRLAPQRVVAAPAFGAAAALAAGWDPHPDRLPVLVGTGGLAAAVVAAVGRALDERSEEALRVWVVGGSAVFVVTGLGTLLGAPPRVTWGVLLLAAVLAARFVPGLAVDVPDQYLVDLERLAVTAWSARSLPPGRRGRSVVPLDAVGVVAVRGTRTVTAAATAVLAVTVLAAPLLLATATLPIDRIGARCLVFFAGGALLLAARSHRHAAARLPLRAAGLACWIALAAVLLDLLAPDTLRWVVAAAVAGALVLVVAAVALGRGWRSAWWSRRAEVAEGLCGAFALAALVVASGGFRGLWEITSLWELGS